MLPASQTLTILQAPQALESDTLARLVQLPWCSQDFSHCQLSAGQLCDIMQVSRLGQQELAGMWRVCNLGPDCLAVTKHCMLLDCVCYCIVSHLCHGQDVVTHGGL